MNDAPSVQLASDDAEATPGALLRRERERAGLTAQQAAEDLHLDPWIIEAIEADRFVALGAPVYARGHLRKYATRLGLSVENILDRYEALQDRPHEADPIPNAVATPIRPPRRSFKGLVWLAVAIAVVALVAYLAIEIFFAPTGSPSTSEVSQPQASAQTVSAEPPSSSAAPVESAPELSSGPPEVEALAATPAEQRPASEAGSNDTDAIDAPQSSAAPASASAESDAAAPIQVRLEFTDECWTEIYDASGARLFFGMGMPQRVRTLVGTPPIQVNLGAASAVSLQVNGESVVIPRREGRESTRFTIDPDGNLR